MLTEGGRVEAVSGVFQVSPGDGGGSLTSRAAPCDTGARRSGRKKGSARERDTENVKVTNLSNKKLSTDQLSLLSKGLGFVPVKRQRTTNLLSELKDWERLVRLKEFWSDSSRNQGTDGTLQARIYAFLNKTISSTKSPTGRQRRG